MRSPSSKEMSCSEVDWMELYFATETEAAQNCCDTCLKKWKNVEYTYARRIYEAGFKAGKESKYKTVLEKAKECGEL